jgi:hypothetical protein
MLQLKDDFTHQPSTLNTLQHKVHNGCLISSSSHPLFIYCRMNYQLKKTILFFSDTTFKHISLVTNFCLLWKILLVNVTRKCLDISLMNKCVCTNCTASWFKESLKCHYQTVNERTGETGIGSLLSSVGNTALHINHTMSFVLFLSQ